MPSSTARAQPRTFGAPRRRFLARTGAFLATSAIAGCAPLDPGPRAWQQRLRGDTVALLGEVHDNAELHRLRAAALRRACEGGWRPVLALEQFDLDRQADLDRARRERPRDVAHLIGTAAPDRSGWHWPFYEPLIALALELDLGLLAANLPRAQAGRIVGEGVEAVLGERRSRELGLAGAPDAALLAAQQREIEAGHCGALPGSVVPGMARAQLARDAAMAGVLRRSASQGAVLVAGNGHVRRDLGVPRWLGEWGAARLLAVGFLETGDSADADAFDAVVYATPAPREDPCAAFRGR
jgi:uncharacterized iron-regulated protein